MNSEIPAPLFGTTLSTGGNDHFLPKLVLAINNAIKIDMTVAFVRETGIRLLIPALREAIERGAKLRILTCDYMQITDPSALRALLLLAELEEETERAAEIKIFESRGTSFHMKAYIFTENEYAKSCAFIGSSNITKSALTTGLEWNLRVEQAENPARFKIICNEFEQVFNHPQSVVLTASWIETYQSTYQEPNRDAVSFAPGADELAPVAKPNGIQVEALAALDEAREEGQRRGLVVLATGMGKTWLSAFDSRQMNAKRILFVAHREEILFQAEDTFVRIHSAAKVGRYTGKQKQLKADILFASIQTLGLQHHLDQFGTDYFDYIVVDEFHHASARTYQQLLAHFTPRYLLGLTATPDRTDQSDILSLCDDNLVYRKDLFDGISSRVLAPFHYYGIGDETVNYQEISWRSNKFDHNELVNQLVTLARANHALKYWRKHKQTRTLAFCISKKHADFMAEHFSKQGIKAVAVHSDSTMRRNQALSFLEEGVIDVVFSVDLFNEGVDVPAIDTVLMLRPTESKIIFLQQLGRGLRRCEGKDKLVVVDFIGNHYSFFNKPEALFGLGKTNTEKKEHIETVSKGNLELPEGCFVNYDLVAIDFMRQLTSLQIDSQIELYQALKMSLGHRPNITAFYHAGGKLETIRKEYGSWWQFVLQQGDLSQQEQTCWRLQSDFLLEVEVTRLSKSFKLVLLEGLLERDGFKSPVDAKALSQICFELIRRRKRLQADLPDKFKGITELDSKQLNTWNKYWLDNPVNAWVGGNKVNGRAFFAMQGDYFAYAGDVADESMDVFNVMLQELVNYRCLQYEQRLTNHPIGSDLASVYVDGAPDNTISYFSDLKIACGHFKSSTHNIGEVEQIALPQSYGHLDSAKHFVARAAGNSMNGGKQPVNNGDYLLLEYISPDNAGSISNQVVAIERQDASGDDQYLLRYVKKLAQGQYELIAKNPDYESMIATEEMITFARLKSVIDPLDLYLHKPYMREDIPALFGLVFNTGAWQSGHVTLKDVDDQFLFVTLNKQGKSADHQYHDYFTGSDKFHWQSQGQTAATSGKGKRLIEHKQKNSKLHLFVRKNKLEAKKGAPFYYCGTANYFSHEGEKPMNVMLDLERELPEFLQTEFVSG